jgi:hypothetical protein
VVWDRPSCALYQKGFGISRRHCAREAAVRGVPGPGGFPQCFSPLFAGLLMLCNPTHHT